jgi:ABC-2 type transport system permease protein
MWVLFGHALNRFRGQILGWGITLGVLSAYLLTFYDTLIEQRAQLEQLLASYPPELLAFFGDIGTMFTPAGYLTVEFFSYMPLILGVFAILAGSGLLVGDEESGVLDLLLSHPVRRSSMFFARTLALLAATAAIQAIMWLGFVIGLNWTALDLSWGELALPFVTLSAVLLVFAAFSILTSMLLPSRRMAAMAGGIVVVGSFFLTALARIDERLEAAARFSPLNYYQSGDAILGLNWEWLGGLAAVALAMILLAWWRFERRDIRVGGEGSWGLPRLRRRATA